MSNRRDSKSPNSNFDYIAQIGAITLLAFIILTLLLFALGNKTVYESKTFLAIINIIFLSALPFAVAYISSSSYLRSGLLQLLLLGGAMVTFGICNLIAAWGILSVSTPEWTNFLVTVHNSGVLVFGIVTFAASILSSIKTSRLNPNAKNRKLSVALAYAAATILAIILAALTLAQDTPPFVILGEFTLLRQSILVVAIVLLFASAFLFGKKYFDTKSRIVYWYALGLGLIGMGILGILIEPHLGTPLSWTGRAAQYVGCVFFVIAALSKLPKSGVDESWVEAFRSDRLQLSNLFSKMLDGFAYHKIEIDDQGKPKDYVFLEVNDAFEKVTGLKRQNIIGKKATQALPGLEKDPANWIGLYGHVALTGEPTQFENYAQPLNKWFRVSAYCPEKGYFVTLFEDITESKKLEMDSQRLFGVVQQERDRLSSLLNSITDEVWFADTEKKFILANPSAIKEFKLESSLGSTDVENLAAASEVYRADGSPRPVEEAPPLRALKGEIVKNQEEIVRTPSSGELRYRQISAAPVKDAVGKIIGSVSVVRDVTESKKVEEALVESEQLYHTVFDNSQDGFQLIELIYDEQGKPIDHKFLKVNQAYEKIIGVKAEDILDKTAKYISPNQETHWLEVPDRVAKTGIPEHVELYNKDINKTLDCYYFPYSKNLVGTLFRDITERKKDEEAIRRQASLIDLSPDAIMVTSFEGVISFWNKGAEKLYGWTISEAIGQIAHYLLKTKSPESISIIKAKVKTYGCWTGELYHKTKDGKEVVVHSWWLADKDEHGEVKSILESNMDITNRKRLEKQLQDAERLAAIGATAGMVGHDIRNPLQAITSDIYLAKTELASTPESEEKKNTLESLQEIEKNVDYINNVHDGNGFFDVLLQQAFGQFELEELWIDGMALHRRLHLIHEISLAELLGTHVHRQRQVTSAGILLPCLDPGAGSLQHPQAYGQNQPGFLGQRNE